MERNEEEKNHTSDALDQIKPISRIRIGEIIGPRFNRDDQPIDGVIDERYKDSADFHKQNIRNRLQVFDGVVKVGGTSQELSSLYRNVPTRRCRAA